MPNTFAYLALLAWPAAAWMLFRVLPFERALIWSILGAYLVLPPAANFDFPLIPPFDKSSIPNFAAFLIVTLACGRRTPFLAGPLLVRMLILLFIFSPVGTALTNADPLLFEGMVLPAVPPSDALAQAVKQVVLLLPFLLARRFLATEAAQREILVALLVAGLAYSIPMLLEIRLSPQLNVWVYGFFPHTFDQQMRFGGFRPVVFLVHGLIVAIFALSAVIAAFGLWRAERRQGGQVFFLQGLYLSAVLVLCKTVGVLVYSVLALPVLLFAGRRTQVLLAAAIGSVVLAYPVLRGAELIPVEAMVESAMNVNEERAGSLAYRLRNEAEVLAHAQERPIFGWGGFERNFVRDPVTGATTTVLDGRWVIVISLFGWSGYIAEFGLLTFPLILLGWRLRGRPSASLSPYVGPVALVLAFYMFDMLPNAPLSPFTWLLAGALLGYAETTPRTRTRAAPERRPIETVL